MPGEFSGRKIRSSQASIPTGSQSGMHIGSALWHWPPMELCAGGQTHHSGAAELEVFWAQPAGHCGISTFSRRRSNAWSVDAPSSVGVSADAKRLECAGLSCSLYASVNSGRRSANPKGIPAQSPGLRGTSYPGKSSGEIRNPNGVVANMARKGQKRIGRNPVGVGDIWGTVTQGSSFLAGLADTIPLGLKLRIRSRTCRRFRCEGSDQKRCRVTALQTLRAFLATRIDRCQTTQYRDVFTVCQWT